MSLCKLCYQLTQDFPSSEFYGVTNKIRRSALSISSNITEGYGKQSKLEHIHYLRIALGSLRELDTQLLLARKNGLATPELFDPVMQEIDELQKTMVSTLGNLKT